VARFETQSAAKTGALCYLLANSGTTVGTQLYIASHVNVTEAININAQSSSTTAKGIRLMAGSGSAITTGISIEPDCTTGIALSGAMTDGVKLSGANTDAIEISGKNTYGVNVSDSQSAGFYYVADQAQSEGQWVHGVKVELTRTADVQVADTGAWFGAQFVLNCGSSGYTAPTHKVHAIAGIIKGSDGGTTSDYNVARFETQSAGEVGALCYLLSNTGTTVASEMLYIAMHVNTTSAININAQSSTTITNGVKIMSGAGSSFNYGIDIGSATINTADIRLASDVTISSGSGSPDGSVTAPQGSLYINTAGTGADTLWINENGSTAWAQTDVST